jgi:hypothetical protein
MRHFVRGDSGLIGQVASRMITTDSYFTASRSVVVLVSKPSP